MHSERLDDNEEEIDKLNKTIEIVRKEIKTDIYLAVKKIASKISSNMNTQAQNPTIIITSTSESASR